MYDGISTQVLASTVGVGLVRGRFKVGTAPHAPKSIIAVLQTHKQVLKTGPWMSGMWCIMGIHGVLELEDVHVPTSWLRTEGRHTFVRGLCASRLHWLLHRLNEHRIWALSVWSRGRKSGDLGATFFLALGSSFQ